MKIEKFPLLTHYKATGSGEPLIFIHGVGLDHTMWHQQIEYFSAHYTVFAYDMLGHGETEKMNQDAYSLEDFVEQLATFFQTVQIEQAHIVGFSMGGMVAQLFSITYPEMVKTLTIANAVANRTKEEQAAVLKRVKRVEEKGKDSTIDPAIERWFTASYLRANKEVIESVKKRLKQNDEKSYVNAYRVFATADETLWNQLTKIKAPTLIITGEHDIGSNPRMAKQMHEKIGLSEVVIVENARHMLPVELPQQFNEQLHRFLRKE